MAFTPAALAQASSMNDFAEALVGPTLGVQNAVHDLTSGQSLTARAPDVPVGITCELPEPMHLQSVAALVDEGPFVMMREPSPG